MPRLLSFSQERTALRQTFSDMMKSRAVALARSENVDNKKSDRIHGGEDMPTARKAVRYVFKSTYRRTQRL